MKAERFLKQVGIMPLRLLWKNTDIIPETVGGFRRSNLFILHELEMKSYVGKSRTLSDG